jgi:hypothetical protein
MERFFDPPGMPHIDNIVVVIRVQGLVHNFQGCFLALAAAQADIQAILKLFIGGGAVPEFVPNLAFFYALANADIHFDNPAGFI